MLWIIIITILMTIAVIKLGRRFAWSPAHILRLEGYEWMEDVLDWMVANYDWSKLGYLISESIQEQFKKRAPPGWTLKLEGPPLLPSSIIQVQKSTDCITLPPNESSNLSKLDSKGDSTQVHGDKLKTPERRGQGIRWGYKSPQGGCPPIRVARIQTISKNHREVVLWVEVKVAGWSQEAFITSRHTNQLESSKCRLELVKLTGQIKVRFAGVLSEDKIHLSTCFSGPPKINILIPRTSFKMEETMMNVDRLLKESISNFGVTFPLFLKKEAGKKLEMMMEVSSRSKPAMGVAPNETPKTPRLPNRLNVKVLKANSLYDKGNHEAYCVVTVDSPPQTQKTSSVADSPNPFFDELLKFHLDETTKTVSFVVQDRSNSEASLGRADLLLRDASNEGVTEKGVKVVLPLMSQRPTSHMSLTIEISSAVDDSNIKASNLPILEVDGKSEVFPSNFNSNFNSTSFNPSIKVEKLPSMSQQSSDQNFRHSLDQRQWRRQNSQTDSNLSLVSQASLIVRNNSNESEASKGPSKRKSFMDAMKKTFRGKRSRSAESPKQQQHQQQPSTSDANKVFSDGIYLTPPPKRPPGNLEHWSLSSSFLSPSDGNLPRKKKGKMSSFKNLFRKKGQSSSPSLAPTIHE